MVFDSVWWLGLRRRRLQRKLNRRELKHVRLSRNEEADLAQARKAAACAQDVMELSAQHRQAELAWLKNGLAALDAEISAKRMTS